MHSARYKQRIGALVIRKSVGARIAPVEYNAVIFSFENYIDFVFFIERKIADFIICVVIRVGFTYPCVYLSVSINL